MIDEDALNIYTDGSSYPNPRRGGMGILIIYVDKNIDEIEEPIIPLGYKQANNQQMELLAVVTALNEILNHEQYNNFGKIIIYSDSMYVINNYGKAIFQWKSNKWKKESDEPASNAVQWEEFVKVYKKVRKTKRINIVWVRNKSNKYARKVDKLAKQSAKGFLQDPLYQLELRKKLTHLSTVKGCVKMEGQTIVIRIIGAEWQPVQKTNKYRYEVMSKDSKYFQFADFVFSNEEMRPYHQYLVTFNNVSNNPQILEKIEEIIPDENQEPD